LELNEIRPPTAFGLLGLRERQKRWENALPQSLRKINLSAVTLTLPDEPALQQFTPEELRLELACALYRLGKIGKVAGAELVGVDFFAFQGALGERGISNYTVEDLRSEIEALNELFPH
jgi:predicted HTH domain antitoxin